MDATKLTAIRSYPLRTKGMGTCRQPLALTTRASTSPAPGIPRSRGPGILPVDQPVKKHRKKVPPPVTLTPEAARKPS